MEELEQRLCVQNDIVTLQEDQQSQLTWLFGASETEPPTKEHTQAEPRSTKHVGDMQLLFTWVLDN